MKEVKIGLIGAGAIAHDLHLPASLGREVTIDSEGNAK